MAYAEDDLSGVMEKRNRYGRWQSRWVIIEGPYLKYWRTKGLSNSGADAANIYDCRDVSAVESIGKEGFDLVFKDGTRLSLRAPTVQICMQWMATIRRRCAGNNARNAEMDEFDFQTTTFSALMILSVEEQTQWVNDTLNEAFHPTTQKMTAEQILVAAKRVLLAFQGVCEDCNTEIKFGEPRVATKCRRYMSRYAQLLESRLMLELQPIVAKNGSHQQLIEINLPGLSAALQVLRMLETASTQYGEILPEEVFDQIRGSLVGSSEVMSAIVAAGVNKIEKWWAEKSANGLMGSRLGEAPQCVHEYLTGIDSGDKDMTTYVQHKACTSMLLIFGDRMATMAVDYTDELGLAHHINGCETCSRVLQRLQSGLGSEIITDYVLDAVITACDRSAEQAARIAVSFFFDGAMLNLLAGLIQPSSESWHEGEAIVAITRRVDFWLKHFTDQVVSLRRNAVTREAMAETVYRYFEQSIERYRAKHTFHLDEEGVERVVDDVQYLNEWITETHGDALESSNSKDGAVEVIRTFQLFMTSPTVNLVLSYINRLRLHGGRLYLNLYDLLRFCLKVRADVERKDRKNILALCADAVDEVRTAFKDVDDGPGAMLIRKLTAQAGQRHCTGKPWSMEKARIDPAMRTFILSIIAECSPASVETREISPDGAQEDITQGSFDAVEEANEAVEPILLDVAVENNGEDLSRELDEVQIDHSEIATTTSSASSPDPPIATTPTAVLVNAYAEAETDPEAFVVRVTARRTSPPPAAAAVAQQPPAQSGRSRKFAGGMWDSHAPAPAPLPAPVPTPTQAPLPVPVASNPFGDDEDANPFESDTDGPSTEQPLPAEPNPFGSNEDCPTADANNEAHFQAPPQVEANPFDEDDHTEARESSNEPQTEGQSDSKASHLDSSTNSVDSTEQVATTEHTTAQPSEPIESNSPNENAQQSAIASTESHTHVNQPTSSPERAKEPVNPFGDDDDDDDDDVKPVLPPKQRTSATQRMLQQPAATHKPAPVASTMIARDSNEQELKQQEIEVARAEFGTQQTTIWTSDKEGRYAQAKQRVAKKTGSFRRTIAAERDNW